MANQRRGGKGRRGEGEKIKAAHEFSRISGIAGTLGDDDDDDDDDRKNG